MDDAPATMQPDDPSLLKALLAQRDQKIAQRDDLLARREQRIAELERNRVELERARDLRIAELEQARDQRIAELERERDRRIAELERRRAELEKQRDQKIAELELERLRLAHQLELLKKRCYGPRADRVDLGQLLLDFATDLESRPVNPQDLPPRTDPATVDAKTVRRVRRGRRNLADLEHLPVLRVEHDLGEDQKHCPQGHERQKIGEVTTWQIERAPGFFYRVEHVQIKYGCKSCEAEASNPQITLTPKPAQPIEKGLAGPGLLAYVITSKFSDYLPLYRLQNIFARNGFEIDRSTLCVWAGDVADLVKPVYDAMVRRVLQSHVIGTDDTVMPMLAPHKAKPARMWVYRGDKDHPYTVFDFTISRSRDGPARFLGDYHGTLLADAYGGYDGICLEKDIVQAGCWAHARRKFVDSRELSPAIADEMLVRIRRLFEIESSIKGCSPGERLAVRRDTSVPVLADLHGRLLARKQQLLPKHPVAQAIGYVLNQWKPLNTFAGDGAVDIDNNLSEQEMKRQALNRKNSLFVGNERGGRTAAILCSITSTCRRHQIDPQLYLTHLLTNLPATPMSQVEQWLADAWKPRQADALAAAAAIAPPLGPSTQPR